MEDSNLLEPIFEDKNETVSEKIETNKEETVNAK